MADYTGNLLPTLLFRGARWSVQSRGVGLCVVAPAETGDYRITETVDRLGVAGPYRVLLLDRATGRVLAGTTANGSGEFVFDNLPYRYQGYAVVGFDDTVQPVQAAISDYLTPEPMA